MGKITPLEISEKLLNTLTPEEQNLLRPQKSHAVGLEVVVKFHRNQLASQLKKNPFVSWTLNKIAVIDRDWLNQWKTSECPINDMDWWRVKIESETSPGQPLGCFVVKPLWKIERNDLAILVPSTWDQAQMGQTVILYPKIRPWLAWIIPKALRKNIMRKTGGSALVIPLEYQPEEKPTTSSEPINNHFKEDEE
jgi:hypothetical protein